MKAWRRPILRWSTRSISSARATASAATNANKLAQEIWSLVVDEVWQIGTVGQGAGIAVTSNNMGNVPRNQCPAQHCRTPATSHPPTYYFIE